MPTIYTLGLFRVAERKEKYEDEFTVEVTAQSLEEDGSTVFLALSEDEAAEWDERGISLEAGADVEVAIIHTPDA